ncbi:SCL-interrupting locus protein [Elysia marginata]|uniref:SCL-interrupting locus protein n=1 Tax=Elysia marginata TaxID=1093978 RepID=A0AAV4JEI4_9GAST|nr:SCL-interrupting locus protein [Elysia marginata]
MISLSNLGALPTDRPPDMKSSLGFPKTSCSLWDKTATGNPVFLHMGYYRKPKICIPEKILRLIQHQCENYSQTHHMLLGSLVVEEDGEGVQFQVDRLDTRNKIPSDGSGLAPGDLLIPLEVSNNIDKERSGSVEDYHCAIKRLQSRCCSKASVDLCEFVLLRGWGSYYSNAHSSVVHLDFDMVTMETVFKATPIPPVPILLTALSKNLAGPMSLSQMQGTIKTGYLSMDHTRKLLLVLESDPKACSLPLIGIWVAGAEFVQHPFVWASCLRYIHNTHLQDRVCMPPNEFLLVVYTPLHSRPEFYQCLSTSGTCALQFQLRSGHEVTNMTKALSAPCSSFTEVELDAVEVGTKLELFDAAKAEHGLDLSKADVTNGNMSRPEDIEPRCVPTPHMDRVPSIRPMVPDVSVLWAETSDSLTSQQQQHLPPPTIQLSYPPTLNHNVSVGQLKQHYHPHHLPNSSHFTPVNTASETTTSVSHNHSCGTLVAQSSPMQQYMHPQVPFSQVFVSNSGSYATNPLPGYTNMPPKISNVYQQNAVNGAFNSQNIRAQKSQLSQPNVLSPLVEGAYSGSVPPQTLSGFVSSVAPRPFTNPSPSSIGCQSQTAERAIEFPLTQVSKAPIVLASTSVPQEVLPYAKSSRPNRGELQILPSSSTLWQNQVQNSSSQPCPFLTTVVEESSSSQSSSSSSVPSTTSHVPHLLNGNILALSSQSLGFNSTRGNGSSHSNNSAATCQSSDDDDSGLSITPDKVNTFATQQSMLGPEQPQGATSSSAMVTSASLNHNVISLPTDSVGRVETKHNSGLDGVKWDDVPPAVRALLEQQNQQLKVLQQQIQMLLHNQSQQSAFSVNQSQQASSVVNSSPQAVLSTPCCRSASGTQTQYSHNLTASHDKTTETCSIGVNTTILEDSNCGHNSVDSHSVQTSPVKTFGHSNFFLSPVLGDRSNNCNSNEAMPATGNTPSELQHHSHPPISSTTYETPGVISRSKMRGKQNSPTSRKDFTDKEENSEEGPVVSQKDLVSVMAGLPIQDQTVNTVASELVVDMPDYASSVNDGVNFDRSFSPPSVSKCYGQDQDDSYSTVAEDAMDPKQYYNQLMNNIQMFLTNDKNREADLSDAHLDTGTAQKTGSPTRSGGDSSTNSSMIPRINYVSMMLGNSLCGSPVRGGLAWDLDPGQSMEINAMAMKYLSDEQLTQMAMLRQMQSSSSDDAHHKRTARALQKVMEKHPHTPNSLSLADVSQLGISPNNMTMATQKYLEKHGLLGNSDSMLVTPGRGAGNSEISMFDHSLKLRTDFSMAQSNSGKSTSSSKRGGNKGLHQPVSPVKSPLRQHVINTSLNYAKQDSPQKLDGYFRPVQGSNVNASPAMRQLDSKQIGSSGNVKGIKTCPVQERPEQVHSPRQRLSRRQIANLQQNDSVSTDDPDEENILDIARLKQMPKLL